MVRRNWSVFRGLEEMPPGPGALRVPLALRRTNGCRAEIDVLGEAESL